MKLLCKDNIFYEIVECYTVNVVSNGTTVLDELMVQVDDLIC